MKNEYFNYLKSSLSSIYINFRLISVYLEAMNYGNEESNCSDNDHRNDCLSGFTHDEDFKLKNHVCVRSKSNTWCAPTTW